MTSSGGFQVATSWAMGFPLYKSDIAQFTSCAVSLIFVDHMTEFDQ